MERGETEIDAIRKLWLILAGLNHAGRLRALSYLTARVEELKRTHDENTAAAQRAQRQTRG